MNSKSSQIDYCVRTAISGRCVNQVDRDNWQAHTARSGVILILITVFVFSFLTSSNVVAAENSPTKPVLLELGTPQLTAQWWQWAMSETRAKGSLSDPTGVRCALNQTGEVWFLAGGFGTSKISRKCTLPEGKSLFFPLINNGYYPPRGGSTLSCVQAKALSAQNNNTAIDLFAELNGVVIEELKQYRIRSEECFDIFARVPPERMPYNAFPSATDGFWLHLRALPRGEHVLKFGGRYNRESAEYGRMVQDIEYILIVQ